MSSASPSATVARAVSVDGFTLANVLPEAASTHCALMSMRLTLPSRKAGRVLAQSAVLVSVLAMYVLLHSLYCFPRAGSLCLPPPGTALLSCHGRNGV